MAYPVAARSGLLTKYHLCNEIPISEIGRAYSTYGRRREVWRVSVWKSRGKRST